MCGSNFQLADNGGAFSNETVQNAHRAASVLDHIGPQEFTSIILVDFIWAFWTSTTKGKSGFCTG